MTRIFLSHSSQDNPRAFALAQWLRENGWEDVFLDRIPRQGIAAGEDWKAKIHESMDASAAGIFLISRGWLDSKWCRTELTLAYNLNKLIFGVVVDDLPRDQIPDELKSNWQVVFLHGRRDHDTHVARYDDGTNANTTLSRSGLANLKEGLHRARIAPEHFTWPPEDEPDRAPWRGLSPMEPQDAGIFFGRDAQTARALDTIRKLREGNPPRLLAIVGASGAGKSSFLRAGLIPRLRRDDRNYLTLPLIRPEGGALDAFAQSLTEAAAEKCPRALGDIRGMVHAAAKGAVGDLTAFLTELGATHRLPAFDDQPPPTPTILLPIDQGEELFQSTGRAQGGPFLSLLARLLQHDSPKFLALITIRSDSYEPLQNAPELSGLEHSPLSLSAIARGEYGRIITGPVEKLQSAGRKLEFDPAITDILLAEFDKGLGRDALPLLAFTLDRLYRDYHSAGKITQANYLTMGGIAGSIDAAVDRALQSAAQHRDMPTDGPAQHALLRRTMIPWFAGVDPETNTARRNVSHYSQLPPATRPLVDALVEQRLLTRDDDTVEPAHEALLREWRALNDWLIADRERLTTLEALRRAAAEWQARGRHKDYLLHKAGRLEEAEQLAGRPDLWQQLGPDDRAYLVACRAAVKRGVFLRRAVAAAFAVVVGIGVIATGYQARVASQQAEIAAERDHAAQGAEIEARAQAELARIAEAKARTQTDIAQQRMERVESLNANIEVERRNVEKLRTAANQARREAVFLLARTFAEDQPVRAIQLILGAWPQSNSDSFTGSEHAISALAIAIRNTLPSTIMEIENGTLNDFATITPRGYFEHYDGGDPFYLTRGGDRILLDGHDGGFWIGTELEESDYLATIDQDYDVRFWNEENGELLGEAIRIQDVAKHRARFVANRRAFSIAGYERVQEWELLGRLPLIDIIITPNAELEAVDRKLTRLKWAITFSAESNLLLVASSDGILNTLSLPNFEHANKVQFGDPDIEAPLSISPDGSMLAFYDDLAIKVVDINSPNMTISFAPLFKDFRGMNRENFSQLSIDQIEFSNDGGLIGYRYGRIVETYEIKESTQDFFASLFPSRHLLTRDHTWPNFFFHPITNDVTKSGTLATYPPYTFLSISPNGELRAQKTDDCTYSISHTGDTTQQEVFMHEEVTSPFFPPFCNLLTATTFSPNSAHFIGGDRFGTVQVWDATFGERLGRLFSPGTPSGYIDPVVKLSVSPDALYIATITEAGRLRVWRNLPPGNILQVACRYLPHINGRPDTSTEGLAAEIGIEGLTLPEDCDTYDPPLPPEFRR